VVSRVWWELFDGEQVDGDLVEREYAEPGIYRQCSPSGRRRARVPGCCGGGDRRPARPGAAQILSRGNARLPAGRVPLRRRLSALGAGKPALKWSLGKEVGGEVVGAPAGIVVVEETGEVIWVPNREQVGEQRIVLLASNDTGTDQEDFLVTVRCDPGKRAGRCGSARTGRRQDGRTAVTYVLVPGLRQERQTE